MSMIPLNYRAKKRGA